MDRFLARIVAAPIFSDVFVQSLIALRLDCAEKIIVLDASSGSDFLEKVFLWNGSVSSAAFDSLSSNVQACDALVAIVHNRRDDCATAVFYDLGFGKDDLPSARVCTPGTSETAKKIIVSDAVLKYPKKQKVDPRDVGSSLKTKEQRLLNHWAHKLRLIAARAGEHAKINWRESEDLLTVKEQEELKTMVLSMGSYRTLMIHVRHWERFEEFCTSQKRSCYPVILANVKAYALHLKNSGCGFTVIPSFLTAAGFVGYRLTMDLPDLQHAELVAIKESVVKEKGREVKEAEPFPLKLVVLMERALFELDEEPALQVFIWWFLVMIYGSLRFDDACHVDPAKIEMTDNAMFGVIWQTKTERRRRGTKFAIPKIGLSTLPWLQKGFEVFQTIGPRNRDYFVPEINTAKSFHEKPPTYNHAMIWLAYSLKRVLKIACSHRWLQPGEGTELLEVAMRLAGHSGRVTLLSLAVHEGESEQAIGLQANWKDPGPMVLKYARNRKEISAKMVDRLISSMRSSWEPKDQAVEDIIDEDEDVQSPEPLEFFLKKSKRVGSLKDLKFHVKVAAGSDEAKTACLKFNLIDLVSVGTAQPELASICSACIRARELVF